MYLVAWEHADDGMWCSEPSGFDTKAEAEKYASNAQDALLPGNCIAIYRCELVKTIDGPALSQADSASQPLVKTVHQGTPKV